jgi:polyketide synthase-associated protein
MLQEWDPSTSGLTPGQLVEVTEPSLTQGGRGLGQLQCYNPEANRFTVDLIANGDRVEVDPKYVAPATPSKPGCGGDEDSFDVVLGARTLSGVLGEEIAESLTSKGFCVLKAIQRKADLEDALRILEQADSAGKLGRLPMELEEGHLGKNGRGKVVWLDPDDDDVCPKGSLLDRNDAMMSNLAQILGPYNEDVVGCQLTERTPALACLSMVDADEAEYEALPARDGELKDYYSTWCRSAIRLVHFMGPAQGKITLTSKATNPIETSLPEININACNTILLVREACWHYSLQEPELGKACWMQCFLMKPGTEFDLTGDIEGDAKGLLEKVKAGPAGPNQMLISVSALAIQAAANMFDHHKEWAMYIAGTDGQLEFPFKRFDYRPYYSEETETLAGTTYVKHCSTMEGIDMFDNKIFEIANADAAAMCPQCRQILEVGALMMWQRGYTKKYCNTHAIHASISVGCDKEEWLNMPDVPRSVATNNSSP